ncbi:MAG: FHA domain-containing protein [Phycisphaerales bacterium]|nr:MAG: FHA domain-containing protein [Phycisphaerales bacterium]
MTQEAESATAGVQADATNETTTVAQDTSAPPRAPYLDVFGADIGIFEVPLRQQAVTIGRSPDADITLPNRSVSRVHARIAWRDGEYTVEDAESTSGTTVNEKRIDTHTLGHGDTIQIAMYTLQFRTHHTPAGAEEAAAQAKKLLRGDYCTLPSTMRLRFRALKLRQSSVFESGDTLQVGQGGLLIPTATPPIDGSCLELELSITKRMIRKLLGELMGVVEEDGTQWMCVKLHTMPKKQLEAFAADAEAGQWIDVTPS